LKNYLSPDTKICEIIRWPRNGHTLVSIVGRVPDMEFVFVKGGCFNMGDTFGDGNTDESPVHEVCVDDFYISNTEVTQMLWIEIMENNPSYCWGYLRLYGPVDNVSWKDVQEFISKLNQETGQKYRLPTEAEWEYAAREGGKNLKWAGTNNKSELDEYAWYYGNTRDLTHPVGQKKPNALGLYDMSGNVCEWVLDKYDSGYYKNSPKNNPQGPSRGSLHFFRGGSWLSGPDSLRTSYRGPPDGSHRSAIGFRLARIP
jgi:formylglycine-generating enzyme required for sulfatase activity